MIYFQFFWTATGLAAFGFVTSAKMCVSFQQYHVVTQSDRDLFLFIHRAEAWRDDRETGCRQDER